MFVDEDRGRLPTLYWLPGPHRRPCGSRFVANAGLCAAAELAVLLTSCLTVAESRVVECCTTVYEGCGLFWSVRGWV